MSPSPRPRWLVPAILVLLLAGGAAAAAWRLLPGDPAREAEEAYGRLRTAILEDDDETFFMMHCRDARERVVGKFPMVRSWYLSASPKEKEKFLEQFSLTEERFLAGKPRDLVVLSMPWMSGWRQWKDIYRVARVKDVRIETVDLAEGGSREEASVFLDITAALEPGQSIPPDYDPVVVLVRDPEGWRRKAFYRE